MKKIGSGWTYDVYEYKEGKVLKRKKSFLSRAWRIIISDPRELFKINKTIKKLNFEDRNSFSIVEKLKETDFDFATIANPVVLSSNEYKQDLCIPVYVFLKDTKKVELIIDAYVEQIKYFWEYGFAESVYNFTINNGLDREGKIVLIDFNEITDDKDRISNSIDAEVWKKRFSTNHHLSSSQKDYFLQKMAQEITSSNLNLYWKRKV